MLVLVLCLQLWLFQTLDSPVGCGAPKQKTPMGNELTRTQLRFFQSEAPTLNSCRSLNYAHGNESIIYYTDLCMPTETYIYARKKHSFASYPAAKHPNVANLRLQTYDKNQWTFFINTALAIILQIYVPLQKFPFLLRFIIPWSLLLRNWSCPLFELYIYRRMQLPLSMHCLFAYIAKLMANRHSVGAVYLS